MTLPASPPISLSAICAEFGAPANTPLASFLRGGTYVPNTPGNSSVPTALPISMADLLGASNIAPVNLGDHAISSLRGTSVAKATYRFLGTGTVQWASAGGGSGSYAGEWLVSGSASSYEVRVTGATRTGLIGIMNNTWQDASTTWEAALSAGPAVEDNSDFLNVELRPAGGGSVLATAAIELYAERF